MTSPVAALPQIARSWKFQLTNSNSGSSALNTVITPSSSYTFAKVVALRAVNSDSSNPYILTWGRTRGGVFYPELTMNVPANSGYANGVPPVNLMNTNYWIGAPKDADGQPYFFLEQGNGDTLQALSSTQVGSGKLVSLLADGAEY